MLKTVPRYVAKVLVFSTSPLCIHIISEEIFSAPMMNWPLSVYITYVTSILTIAYKIQVPAESKACLSVVDRVIIWV